MSVSPQVGRKPHARALGVESRRLLGEIQARAIASAPDTMILVEGLSDYFAVEAAATRYGRNLECERVIVVPMGGATNLGRFVANFGPQGKGVRLAGLCDRAEADFFVRILQRVGLIARADRGAMATTGFFVCERDLEDELIRALGTQGVEAIIEREGELGSLRTLQQMPFHRGRPIDDQLHRFLGARSGRKYRYAPLFVNALDRAAIPAPLRDLVGYV
jgi:hypothetical protein